MQVRQRSELSFHQAKSSFAKEKEKDEKGGKAQRAGMSIHLLVRMSRGVKGGGGFKGG